MTQSSAPLGVSGRIAGFFLRSQLTPLIALVAALLGVAALLCLVLAPALARWLGSLTRPAERRRR